MRFRDVWRTVGPRPDLMQPLALVSFVMSAKRVRYGLVMAGASNQQGPTTPSGCVFPPGRCDKKRPNDWPKASVAVGEPPKIRSIMTTIDWTSTFMPTTYLTYITTSQDQSYPKR